MTRIFRLNIFALIALTVLSCAGSKNAVQIPSWVIERPINPSYYIGIATASKIEYPFNAREVANENAINSMAREIRVVVSSESVLSTLQVNHWVEESFASQITSTVAEDLEGYTLMGTYESETEVWVYYRLSKADYARTLEERKRVALSRAYSHYVDAEKLKTKGAINTAVERYLMGLDAMSKYLAEENPYIGEDGVEFKLDRALLNGLSGIISNIEIGCDVSRIELGVEDHFKSSIKVDVSLDHHEVEGIPLTYRYSRGRVPISGTTSTSGDGKANILLSEFDHGILHSEVKVELDINGLLEILKPLSPLRSLVENLKATPFILPIDFIPPRIRVVGDEKISGRKIKNQILTPIVKSELVDNGVEVVEQSGEGVMTLYLEADCSVSGNSYGLFTSYLNAHLSLKNDDGELLNHMSIDNIKGVQQTAKRAGEESYRKTKEEISDDFMYEFVDSIYK